MKTILLTSSGNGTTGQRVSCGLRMPMFTKISVLKNFLSVNLLRTGRAETRSSYNILVEKPQRKEACKLMGIE
jgi:hypothetical protein